MANIVAFAVVEFLGILRVQTRSALIGKIDGEGYFPRQPLQSLDSLGLGRPNYGRSTIWTL